jgi:hypothetical protein
VCARVRERKLRRAETRAELESARLPHPSRSSPWLAWQYCWLHRGTYSCALELCTGAPTDKCFPSPR